MKTVRWGIAGPGIIAHKFAEAVQKTKGATVLAAASRTAGKAKEFASEYGIERAYESYEEMAKDPDIDAVYVSTAHPFHLPCAELFIKAKKHILCEKPLCVDSRSAERLQMLASQHNVFLMEGMWTAFLPAIRALQDDIESGVIGVPMGMNGDFCYSIETEEDPKLFESKLCGGSLLDVGVYCLHFAYLIFGEPSEIYAVGNVKNGVDLHTQTLLKYDNGGVAALSSAIKLEKPYDARIYGTEGSIYVPNFYKADRYTVTYSDGTAVEKSYPYGDNGFEFEIKEVCRCINEGVTESRIHPITRSIAVLKQMDKIKSLIGLEF